MNTLVPQAQELQAPSTAATLCPGPASAALIEELGRYVIADVRVR